MSKFTFYRLMVAGMLLFGMASATQATTLDFTTFPSGYQGTTSLTLPQATVTGFGTNLYVGANTTNSICSISGATCEADFKIDFLNNISNLTFNSLGYDRGDSVLVTAYNSANVGIGSFTVAANGAFGFGALAGIRSLYFDDSSTGAGLAFADFTFDQGNVAVAEPNTLPLLLLGLMGIGFAVVRRRRMAGPSARNGIA